MEPLTLSDPADPRLDPFRELPARERATDDVVAESELAVSRWLASPHPVRAVLTTPERWPRLASLVGPEVAVFLAPIALIREVVGFPLRRGAVAWGPRPQPPGERRPGPHRAVVAVGLSDPRNLGALIRNARAFGVDEVVVTPGGADPFSRRAIRAAAGHGFELALRVEPIEHTLARLADALWIATSPRGASRLDALDPGPRWALVVGNEGAGLSPEVLARCGAQVRIPLAPGVDSLNVAAATAICLHALCPSPETTLGPSLSCG